MSRDKKQGEKHRASAKDMSKQSYKNFKNQRTQFRMELQDVRNQQFPGFTQEIFTYDTADDKMLECGKEKLRRDRIEANDKESWNDVANAQDFRFLDKLYRKSKQKDKSPRLHHTSKKMFL